MVTIKELKKNVPDRIIDVYTEGMVTVITIPNGRVKIMPNHRKPGNKNRDVKILTEDNTG